MSITTKQRSQIQAMAAAGIPHAKIAKALDLPIAEVRAVLKPDPAPPAPAQAPARTRHGDDFTRAWEHIHREMRRCGSPRGNTI